jgi:hypothetical protein
MVHDGLRAGTHRRLRMRQPRFYSAPPRTEQIRETARRTL